MRDLRPLPLVALLLTLLTGCAVYDGVKRPAGSPPVGQSRSRNEGLELTWDADTRNVDGFIIRYGPDPAAPSDEIRVPIKMVRKEQDSELGLVYRYVIKDAPREPRLFVRIAAYSEKDRQISEFTEVKGEMAVQ